MTKQEVLAFLNRVGTNGKRVVGYAGTTMRVDGLCGYDDEAVIEAIRKTEGNDEGKIVVTDKAEKGTDTLVKGGTIEVTKNDAVSLLAKLRALKEARANGDVPAPASLSADELAHYSGAGKGTKGTKTPVTK